MYDRNRNAREKTSRINRKGDNVNHHVMPF
jgi:hypothetical protein